MATLPDNSCGADVQAVHTYTDGDSGVGGPETLLTQTAHSELGDNQLLHTSHSSDIAESFTSLDSAEMQASMVSRHSAYRSNPE